MFYIGGSQIMLCFFVLNLQFLFMWISFVLYRAAVSELDQAPNSTWRSVNICFSFNHEHCTALTRTFGCRLTKALRLWEKATPRSPLLAWERTPFSFCCILLPSFATSTNRFDYTQWGLFLMNFASHWHQVSPFDILGKEERVLAMIGLL
jgi:hypothetical protein